MEKQNYSFPEDVVEEAREKAKEKHAAIVFDYKNKCLKVLNTVVWSKDGSEEDVEIVFRKLHSNHVQDLAARRAS